MNALTTEERIAVAQAASDRHAWQDAFAELNALDHEGRLDGTGLELLGTIAWWAGHPDLSVAARERAFAAYSREQDPIRASYMAVLAAWDHGWHQSEAVAQGWGARAARILAEQPESFAHGYLIFLQAFQAVQQGEFEASAELAARAVDIGARFGDKDLQAYGLVCQGTALIRRGDLDEGLRLLDEATAAAVADELSPYASGVVYCQTISMCRDLADYRRAGQWTEVAERWCERQAISGFPGVCRVHRAEIMALHGEWDDAATEAQRAATELRSLKAMPQAADGYYALGEIRLRIGDLEAAADAFAEADALGKEPLPGRALLYLAQGRVDAALSAIERALAGQTRDLLLRAKLLPAHVEIALGAGRAETARAAAEELGTIADRVGSPALQAAAHSAMGAVYVAAAEPDSALREVALARSLWQTVEAPYELARTRLVLAGALALRGEVEEATSEVQSARTAFMKLGATIDAVRCDRIAEGLRHDVDQGARERRTFVFTDIVGSTQLISAIGDEAWGDLVRWHDQALRRIVADHRGEEVNHAGDGFFFAFRDARIALDCAIAIQRTLMDHRRESGFAPRVRIGLHAAEATKVDGSYLGQGVHQAARIGALADSGEIVASMETLDGMTIERVGPARSVELKGIPGLVEVQTVGWTA